MKTWRRLESQLSEQGRNSCCLLTVSWPLYSTVSSSFIDWFYFRNQTRNDATQVVKNKKIPDIFSFTSVFIFLDSPNPKPDQLCLLLKRFSTNFLNQSTFHPFWIVLTWLCISTYFCNLCIDVYSLLIVLNRAKAERREIDVMLLKLKLRPILTLNA